MHQWGSLHRCSLIISLSLSVLWTPVLEFYFVNLKWVTISTSSLPVLSKKRFLSVKWLTTFPLTAFGVWVGSSSWMGLCEISFFSALWCLKKWKMRSWEREHNRWRKIESPRKFPKAFSSLFSFFFEWEIIHVHWSEFWFKPEFKISLGFPGKIYEYNSLF